MVVKIMMHKFKFNFTKLFELVEVKRINSDAKEVDSIPSTEIQLIDKAHIESTNCNLKYFDAITGTVEKQVK